MDNVNPEAGNEPQNQIDVPIEGLPPEMGGVPVDAPGAQTPKLVEYKYDGETFNVSPELAAALSKRDEDYNAGFGQIKTELQSLKANLPAPSPAPASEPSDDEDLLNRLLENPKEVFAELKKDITNDLTKQYQGAEKAKEFERGFWEANKEIQPHKVVFGGYMAENAHRWIAEGLNDQQAYDKCAEMTRRYVLENGGKPSAKPTHTEGPSQPSASSPEPTESPAQFRSISEQILAKKNAEELGPQRVVAGGQRS